VDVFLEWLDAWKAGGQPDTVATSIFLPDYVPDTSAGFAAQLGINGDPVIADPALHYREFAEAQRGVARRHLDYLSHLDPYAIPEAFGTSALDAQMSAGCSVLVSPGLTIGLGALDESLEVSACLAGVTAHYATREGLPLLIGLAATPGAVSTDHIRNDLLNAIVDDFPPGDLYLRVFAKGGEAFRQYADREVLEGLAAIAESLTANGRRLLLPQLGLAGWLLMARGAAAFGSGISSTLQMCCERSAQQRGRQPLPRYFVPELLGFVLREELNVIRRELDYPDCPCPFCSRLLPQAESAWDVTLAGQHYLWWCARLSAEAASSPRPLETVTARIAAAKRFWEQLRAASVSLDPRSEPRHLGAWSLVAR
jgi:hypothetical protein